MPPPMTIPQYNPMTGNIRGQHARHEYNSHGNNNSNASLQQNSANGATSHPDDYIPNLSSRFVGSGRQSSLSQASGGVTVSEGKWPDSSFYYPSILCRILSQAPEFISNNRRNSYAELYEGLKLAQRGRLEDQRGTEIKFEMPDFLKREQQV